MAGSNEQKAAGAPELRGLPQGWVSTTLGDVVQNIREIVDPSQYPDAQYISLENVAAGTRQLLGTTKNRDIRSDKIAFLAGDILYGKLRPNLNKVVVAPFSGFCSTEFLVLRCERLIEPQFIARIASSSDFVEFAVSKATGGGLPRVAFRALMSFEINLPPYQEQKQILGKLEMIDRRLNVVRIALTEMPPLLKGSRSSVLLSAMRGTMTEEWRRSREDVADPETNLVEELALSYVEEEAGSNTILGLAALSVGKPDQIVPKGWIKAKLISVAELESGHTPSRDHPEYWSGDIDWISIPDARENNGMFIESTKSKITQLGLENSAARLLPVNTVCVTRTASLGYVVITAKEMTTSQDFANWICSSRLIPEFLMYAFLAEGEHLTRFGKGTTHPTIYFTELNDLYITLPSIVEQEEIVNKIEFTLQRLNKLTRVYNLIFTEFEELERLVSKKALNGSLVEQSPLDEDASIILEAIKLDRASRLNQPKRRIKAPLMKKLTPDSLAQLISKLDKEQFSFTELRRVVAGSYEEIKSAIFSLLEREDTPLKQIFDAEKKEIQFQKVSK